MKIEVIVNWRERYEGKSSVFLRGVESFGPGEVNINGDFGPIVMYKPTLVEGEVTGRSYDGRFSLRVKEGTTLKMKVLPDGWVPGGEKEKKA